MSINSPIQVVDEAGEEDEVVGLKMEAEAVVAVAEPTPSQYNMYRPLQRTLSIIFHHSVDCLQEPTSTLLSKETWMSEMSPQWSLAAPYSPQREPSPAISVNWKHSVGQLCQK